jgi:hypothetical protein
MDEPGAPLRGQGLAGRGPGRERALGWAAAIAIFLGTLGVFGFGLAWQAAREAAALRGELAALREGLASGAVRAGEAAPPEQPAARAEPMTAEPELAALREELADLGDGLDGLGAELDELAERELALTALEGLSSLGQDQALPLGAHLACFLIYTNEGTPQSSACELQLDAATGSWALWARSAECRAACVDWR